MEVAKILDKLVPFKAPGSVNINTDMVREILETDIIYLIKLVNVSFKLKNVPLPKKLAHIIIVLKPG